MERRRPPCRRPTDRRAPPLQLEILARASLYASSPAAKEFTVIPCVLRKGGRLFISLGSWAARDVGELTFSRPQLGHTSFQAASQGKRRRLTP